MQDDGSADLGDYCVTLSQLIDWLRIRRLFHKWLEYEDLVDSVPVRSASYQAPLSRPSSSLNGPGRPSFNISKDQVFKLFGIQLERHRCLLKVSGMTIYRLVVRS